MRVHQRRYAHVKRLIFPQGAPLVLKAKRREGAIVRTAQSDSGAKEVAMSLQIRDHRCTVGMTAHSDSFTIDESQLNNLFDGGPRIHRVRT